MTEIREKILIFSLAYQPFIGGAEVAIKEITDRLGGSFDFDMITADLDGGQKAEERIGNVNVYRVSGQGWKKYLFPWLAARKAATLHGDKQYRLVWAMMANQAGWAALKFKRRFPQVKYLLTLQEGDSDFDIWIRTWFMRPIYKSIYRRADAIQAISNFLAARAKKLGAKCAIEVVPNGVDPAWFTQMGYDELFRLRKSPMFGGHLIMTASRLVEKNGIEYLIRAMSDIDGRLIILGEGKLREQLERLVKELKIERKVDFRGFINQEKIHDLLIDASVFCRPSLSEGLGNSFLEAMAVKIPVIATPVGGIPDFLKDSGPDQTGWFCKVKDPQSIAEKINYILDEKNKAEVDRVVENAWKLVAEKYTWDRVAHEMNTIFDQVGSRDKKRLLIATGIYPPDIGGPATIVGELKRSLVERGFQVSVITYAAATASADDGVVRIRKNGWKSKLSYLYNFWRLSRSADVILATDTYSVGYFAYVIKKLTGKPYILRFAGDSAWETAFNRGWTRDYIVDFQGNKYGRKIESLKDRRGKVMKGADRVIAVSRFMEGIAQSIGVQPENIRMIHNSVDFEQANEISRPEFLKRYGLADGDRVVMTACRLTPWKGVAALVNVVKRLKADLPIKLVILGDGPELSNLKDYAREAGVEDDVVFAGAVKQSEVIGQMSQAEVFVLNTYYEGLSHVLLEAVKAGVPIIATDVGGNPEVIRPEIDGILVKYDDEAGFEAGIRSLLDDPGRARAMAVSARSRASEFSWDNVVDKTIKTINEIR